MDESPLGSVVESRFVKACPSFSAPLGRMLRDWSPERPSLFNVLDELGRHLALRVGAGDFVELPLVLTNVEEALHSGDNEVMVAVTHGLLAAFQSQLRGMGQDPNALRSHFGELTADWWNDLNRNSQGRLDW